MITILKDKFKSFSFGTKRIPSIFFGEPTECPCVRYYKLSSSIKNSEPFLWRNPETIKLPSIKSERNIFIFAHGERKSYTCFYYNNDYHKRYIQDETWKSFSVVPGLTYFHVCYGSIILKRNAILREKFPSWVSYSDEIIAIKSSKLPEIDILTKNILAATYKAALVAKSPKELQEKIIEIHEGLKTQITNADRVSNTLIAFLGYNMSKLTYSN